MKNNLPLSSEDGAKSPFKNQYTNGNMEKSKDIPSQFNPSLSSREMKKIKYYEDMFAKMAHENKSGLNSNNSLGQSLFKSSSSKSMRLKGSEKKSLPEPKDHTSNNHQEDFMLDNHAFSKNSRIQTHKKDVYRNTGDKDNIYSRDKYEPGGLATSDSVNSSSKTLLENKRLMKVQSMPMVTKKKKVLPGAKTDTDGSITPITSEISDTQELRSDFSVNSKDSNEAPKTLNIPKKTPDEIYEPILHVPIKSETAKVVFDEADIVTDQGGIQTSSGTTLKVEHSNDFSDLKTQKDQISYKQDVQEKESDTFVEQILMENIESVTNISYDSPIDQTKAELDEVEFNQYIDGTPKTRKKRLIRSRKGKSKRTPQTKDYPNEQFVDNDKSSLDNDFSLTSNLDLELVEVPKSSVKTRLKSQRNLTRKKRQDEQNNSDIKTNIRTTKVVNRSLSRQSLTTSRSNSGSIDKLHGTNKIQLPSEFVNGEESHINIEYLRIITADEAERIINMCFQHEDIEKLKNLVNTTKFNVYVAKDSGIEEIWKSGKKWEPILDPKHIVAPVFADRQNHSDSVDVPENPLHISFKYRFFKDLNTI
ncbi:hypothetical protein BEWA_010340 [Theileria equi strain WA]|uniref:Uncharacterized protein n=1 Tax=Theileria equi strain WA TaxID=1537102 RepID=L0B297_THEEQ|nr:hypothetical protein BEWA_010340 [Theileria equi strain WA]AFZ81618.1 hypothetical protein BEWA_010340 [Theileria equi strain WA]|eukprot:XP_004831284.1 hypothetical protein BEWA_010340 [Theileria equi strain WA]